MRIKCEPGGTKFRIVAIKPGRGENSSFLPRPESKTARPEFQIAQSKFQIAWIKFDFVDLKFRMARIKLRFDHLKRPPDDIQRGSGKIKPEMQQAESSTRHLKRQIDRARLEFGGSKRRPAGIGRRLSWHDFLAAKPIWSTFCDSSSMAARSTWAERAEGRCGLRKLRQRDQGAKMPLYSGLPAR